MFSNKTLLITAGFIPLFQKSFKYREYGISVLDPINCSFSEFLSLYYFYAFLIRRKIKFLIFLLIIVIFQILLYRRYAIVWIFISLIFLFILVKRKLPIYFLFIGLIFILASSFLFGYFGNKRSNFDENYILNEFGANSRFTDLNISYYHFVT